MIPSVMVVRSRPTSSTNSSVIIPFQYRTQFLQNWERITKWLNSLFYGFTSNQGKEWIMFYLLFLDWPSVCNAYIYLKCRGEGVLWHIHVYDSKKEKCIYTGLFKIIYWVDWITAVFDFSYLFTLPFYDLYNLHMMVKSLNFHHFSNLLLYIDFPIIQRSKDLKTKSYTRPTYVAQFLSFFLTNQNKDLTKRDKDPTSQRHCLKRRLYDWFVKYLFTCWTLISTC